jgi:HEPN domain-containing protein
MPNRAQDWLKQAERDLEMAEGARHAGWHEWACFAAQQAAEKAVKALHLHWGQEAWGHVVARLLRELPDEIDVPKELVERAHVLDGYYIPARYPNSHPEGAPFEHFGALQSEEAIRYAREILTFVRAQMARRPRGD